MFLSDAPSGKSGLGRITRELAAHIVSDPETSEVFRVGTLGCGQKGYKSLPYPQYPITNLHNYVVPELPDAWQDFSQGQHGILFSIWNPSWLWWLSLPETVPQQFRGLRKFIESKPFDTWGYFPIDAVGPSGNLPNLQLQTINAFDRKLAYTKWAGKLIDAPALPHGIDTSVFRPRELSTKHSWIPNPQDPNHYDNCCTRCGAIDCSSHGELPCDYIEGPKGILIPRYTLKIGICATNTARKDWGLAAETCAILKQRGHKITILAHTNTHLADWSLIQLFEEFDILENACIENLEFTEDEMAEWYSMCDVTLGIGSGEGFGYPLAESLACGVPCIHGAYAGGVEIIKKTMRVEPKCYRYEGYGSSLRPVYDPADWADIALQCSRIYHVPQGPFGYYMLPTLPEEFDWNNLWPRWKQWLLEGVHA